MKISWIKTTATGAVLLAALALGACNKGNEDCPPVTTAAPADEVQRLEQYLASANISATKDERGFYYTIGQAGSGAKPTPCDEVTVNYRGTLTTGEQFDAAQDVKFGLQDLIAGWQAGIPLIAPGGKITLYLPPSLAYGDAAQPKIPANSILVFEIDLVDVTED